MPRKYLHGHGTGNKFGKNSPHWKGGKYICKYRNRSYVRIYMPEHPKAGSNGYIFEHILVAEKAFGKSLPENTVIHHIDGNGLNNENGNLVICQDQSYHMVLHKRQGRLYHAKDCNNIQ